MIPSTKAVPFAWNLKNCHVILQKVQFVKIELSFIVLYKLGLHNRFLYTRFALYRPTSGGWTNP
jgi:hypothetical protein